MAVLVAPNCMHMWIVYNKMLLMAWFTIWKSAKIEFQHTKRICITCGGESKAWTNCGREKGTTPIKWNLFLCYVLTSILCVSNFQSFYYSILIWWEIRGDLPTGIRCLPIDVRRYKRGRGGGRRRGRGWFLYIDDRIEFGIQMGHDAGHQCF